MPYAGEGQNLNQFENVVLYYIDFVVCLLNFIYDGFKLEYFPL